MLRLELGQFLLPIKFARLCHDYTNGLGVVALVEAFPGAGSRWNHAIRPSFPADDFSHAGEKLGRYPHGTMKDDFKLQQEMNLVRPNNCMDVHT